MSVSQKDIVKMMQEFNENEADWAKHSKFYHRIMSDGNIFNPYLHRRFLPTQFNNLVSHIFNWNKGQMSQKEFVLHSLHYCNVHHVIDSITKEVGLLAFLEDKDPMAFEERSAITPLNQCKKAYIDMYDYLSHNCCPSLWRASDLTEDVQNCRAAVFNAKTYAELDKALHAPWKTKLHPYSYSDEYLTGAKIYRAFWVNSNNDFAWNGCREFYNMFLLSGAYYSLKNYYMFNDHIDNRRSKLKSLYTMAVNQRDWGDLTNRYCHTVGINGILAESQAA